MPPKTRATRSVRRPEGSLSITAPIATPPDSPDSSHISLPTPKRRKRKSGEDEYIQYVREQNADDTAVVLRIFGHREEPEKSDPAERWCYCGITESQSVNMEEMIRCANRQCSPGWFHLRCAKLPALPPIRFGWFCRACRKSCNVEGAVNGLICPRAEDGPKAVRDWVEKVRRQKVEETKKPKELRGMWKRRRGSESSEGESSSC